MYLDRDYYLYEFNQSSQRARLFRLIVDDGRIVEMRKLGSYR